MIATGFHNYLIINIIMSLNCYDLILSQSRPAKCIPKPSITCFDDNCNRGRVTIKTNELKTHEINIEKNNLIVFNSYSDQDEFSETETSNCHYREDQSNASSYLALDNCTDQMTILLNNPHNGEELSIDYNDTLDCYQVTDLSGSARSVTYDNDFSLDETLSGRPISFIPNLLKQRDKSQPRYIELLFLSDCHLFAKVNKKIQITRNIQTLVNIASVYFRDFNIHLVLSDIIIDRAVCRFNLTSNFFHGVVQFGEYAEHNFTGERIFDAAVLYTGVENLITVGVAHIGGICSANTSVCIVKSQSTIWHESYTLAHELGHLLGMGHDEPFQLFPFWSICQYTYCIMEPRLPSFKEEDVGFSSQSVKQLDYAYRALRFACTWNEPHRARYEFCGNGNIEDNEECDCFGSTCSKCCQNCTIRMNATCGSGPCCDLETCNIVPASEGRVCRPANDECDLEEVCDGSSSKCPEDLTVHNGWPCDDGFCFNGACGSYFKACDKLFDWASPGGDYCYSSNANGNLTGNCGPPIQPGISKIVFNKCAEADLKCGQVFCSAYGGIRRPIQLTKSSLILIENSYHCSSVILKFSQTAYDFGLVPDGAPCQPDHICVGQKCSPLAQFTQVDPCPKNCQDRGICSNKGSCICNDLDDTSKDCSNSPRSSKFWPDFVNYLEIIFLLWTILELFFLFIRQNN